jgi:hypothetical protein
MVLKMQFDGKLIMRTFAAAHYSALKTPGCGLLRRYYTGRVAEFGPYIDAAVAQESHRCEAGSFFESESMIIETWNYIARRCL